MAAHISLSVIFVVFLWTVATSSISPTVFKSQSSLSWLREQNTKVSAIQANLAKRLVEKGVPVDSSDSSESYRENDVRAAIALSTSKLPLRCRYSLCDIPPGKLAISPCGCTGSQKWIQVSTLNQLRRSDPMQWRICRMCLKPMDYTPFYQYGGMKGNIISFALDNIKLVRVFAGLLFAIVVPSVLPIGYLYHRFISSTSLWQMHSHWEMLMQLPLLMQLWLGQIIVQQLWKGYLVIEGAAMRRLVDYETCVIEPQLPVTVSTEKSSSMEVQDDV